MSDQERVRRAHEREFAEARVRSKLSRAWREWGFAAVALSAGFWALDRFVFGRSLPGFWACWVALLAAGAAGLVALELVLRWALGRRDG